MSVLTGAAGASSGLILVQDASLVWYPLSGNACLLPALAAIFSGAMRV